MSGGVSEGGAASDSLITEEQLKKVLQVDKGSEAILETWKEVTLTKVGDNYACKVIALEVSYSYKSERKEAFYVVKLNPQRNADGLAVFTNSISIKEDNFYSKILPDLNATLESIGHRPLSFPKYYHGVTEANKEQIYFEDLRKKGFQMFDRRQGFDIAHVNLVMTELARFHAASLILQAKNGEPLEETYSTLGGLYGTDIGKKLMVPMMEGGLSGGKELLEEIGGYERAISFVEDLQRQVEAVFTTEMVNGKYDVICHGDCWNNNMLFRYDNNGNPVEVMLLDLQITEKASPATDLNFFLFTSTISEVRRPNLTDFLNSYFKDFAEVMKAGGMEMPFTEDELMAEFLNKIKVGAILGIMAIPFVLREGDDIHDMDKTGTGFKEMTENLNAKAKKMLHSHPHMKPRFLALFDELMDMGIFK